MLNTSEVPRIVSLIFCFIILLAIVMIMILIVCLSNLNGKSKDNDHSMFGEFFEGVKTQRRYKLYVLFLVLRRIVFVMALIMMISVSSRILIGILMHLFNNLKLLNISIWYWFNWAMLHTTWNFLTKNIKQYNHYLIKNLFKNSNFKFIRTINFFKF